MSLLTDMRPRDVVNLPPADVLHHLQARRAVCEQQLHALTHTADAPPTLALGMGAPQVNHVYCMDNMKLLKAMPDESVNCIVTSPPYFGLRDYGVEGQIGLEETPQEFIAALVNLFRECRRVLRSDGTFWLNLGDSYANDDKWGGSTGGKHAAGLHGTTGIGRGKRKTGFKPKDLMMMPHRVAIALQDDGWWVRSDIVWSKPNPMPESAIDRPTKAHEYIFLLTKSADYWYDAEAIREPIAEATIDRNEYARPREKQNDMGKLNRWGGNTRTGDATPTGTTRNKRDVWTITTKPFGGAHFATFPPDLIEPCILAGCPSEVCSKCGAPHERVIETSGGTIGKSWHDHESDLEAGMTQVKHSGGVGSARSSDGQPYTRKTLGFEPTCTCDADTRPGVVLDPFMGAGTTAVEARALGRNYIGAEINPDYVKITDDRLRLPFEARTVKASDDVSGLPMFAAAAS